MELKVQETKIGQVISARDLHEFLEVKSRFNDWFKNRINKYSFEVNQDFIAITKNLVTAQGNHFEEKDYHLSLDMAKELSMIENNEKGRLARKYFIACEKNYLNMIKSQLDLVSMNKNLLNTKEFEKIKGSARTIIHIEEQLRNDMKEMEKIIKRIGDYNANLYMFGTQILDMSKNIEQGKLRDKNEY